MVFPPKHPACVPPGRQRSILAPRYDLVREAAQLLCFGDGRLYPLVLDEL